MAVTKTKFALAVLAAACLMAAAVPAARAQDPNVSMEGVIDLDPTNVKEVLSGMKLTLAEFYAPWCGHCKRLVPEYAKLGEMVAADPMMSQHVQIVKADCDKHRSLGEPFGVTGFPTLKILPRGTGLDEARNSFNYEGAREAEAMFNKLKELVEMDKKVGRDDKLDVVASDFMAADDKAAFLAKPETKTAIDAVFGGELYYGLMEKIVNKGDEYVEKEIARIGRIIAKGKITREKFADMILKQNVLRAFSVEES